jgi:hypothetical protein
MNFEDWEDVRMITAEQQMFCALLGFGAKSMQFLEAFRLSGKTFVKTEKCGCDICYSFDIRDAVLEQTNQDIFMPLADFGRKHVLEFFRCFRTGEIQVYKCRTLKSCENNKMLLNLF